MTLIKNSNKYLKLLRFHQYIKNLLIFAPLFFAADIFNIDLLTKCFYAYASFCLTASSLYIFNDLCDIEYDCKHHIKKNRIIASAKINKKQSFCIMLILAFSGIALLSFQSKDALIILILYIIINLMYSIWLKHIVIIDIIIIAIFYLVRLYIGSIISNIPLTIWIVILTFIFALFIALSKRRNDIIIYSSTGTITRKVIDGYNLKYINYSIIILSILSIAVYFLYTCSSTIISTFKSQHVYLTSIFVIIAIIRYLQILFLKKKADDPVKIFCTDYLLSISFFFWILTFGLIIY